MPLSDKPVVLIIGDCGTGKTWVMHQLKDRSNFTHKKLGKFIFCETPDFVLAGRYTGHVFDGSDRLSMSVITDLSHMLDYIESRNKVSVFEGDRFMNKTFINKADPYIIKILGDGQKGRDERGSSQSDRQIKAISTRVRKIKPNIEVKDSSACLEKVMAIIK